MFIGRFNCSCCNEVSHECYIEIVDIVFQLDCRESELGITHLLGSGTKGISVTRSFQFHNGAIFSAIVYNWCWSDLIGGKQRQIEYKVGTGYWFRCSQGVVQIKWVFVRDLTGTHRDEYLYTTNLSLSGPEIVSLYTSRWAVETTFQECKQHLRLEKTKVWQQRSVLTLPPLLFGAYSIVILLHQELKKKQAKQILTWPGKTGITFSDMILEIRRIIWREQLIINTLDNTGLSRNKGRRSEERLLEALCQVA